MNYCQNGNNVAKTGNIVVKNFNNVEATFDFVERIVRLVALYNVASTLLLAWTGLKALRHVTLNDGSHSICHPHV